MMALLSLLRAEWRKAVGNFWVLGCVFGIWPLIAVGGVLAVAALLFLTQLEGFSDVTSAEELRRNLARELRWHEVALGVWDLTASPLGQFAVLSFAAILFGGEYRWRTWKNLAPRRPRLLLLAGKYAVLALLIITAFAVFSLVATLGVGALTILSGGDYGGFSLPMLGDFLLELVLRAGLVAVASLYLGGAVAIAAILTRSMLIGALGGVAFIAIDGLMPTAMGAVAGITRSSVWLELLRGRFMYNLSNLGGILRGKAPVSPVPDLRSVGVLGDFAAGANTLAGSLFLVGLWLVVLVGLSLWFFRRQDLTR